jgi:septal ring factor EnvC (AmiA/AmiB activator)
MKATFVAAVAVMAALSAPALAQEKAPPPASKADVQKLVDTIKGDKAKLAQFCEVMKLDEQAAAASEKNDQKKVEELSKQEDEISKKISPDFDKVMSALSEETGPLVEDLSKGCPK